MSIKALPSRTERPARGAAATRGPVAVAPRVDLLPPEIGERNHQKAVRRGLKYVVLAVAVIVVLGVAGTWVLATGSQTALASEQSNTQSLIAQQAKFGDVRAAENSIAIAEAAERVGGSTEIDWQAYLTKLQTSLPSGVTLQGVAIDSAVVNAQYTQSQVPLEGARIATLTFTALSSKLPSIPDWLNRLATLPGFVDAMPGSVTLGEGGYTATVTMHINSDAYSGRFTAKSQADRDQAVRDNAAGVSTATTTDGTAGAANGATTDNSAGTTTGSTAGTSTDTTGAGK